MSDPGFASLGPSLLARKGGAKPAMRPQVAPLVTDDAAAAELAEDHLEDLGWNDMGDTEHDGGADVVPIHGDMAHDMDGSDSGPIVRRQQRRLEERVLADAAMTGLEDPESEYDEEDDAVYGESSGDADYDEDEEYEEADDALYAPLAAVSYEAPVVAASSPKVVHLTKKPRVSAVQSGRRAAFTLRLDADRHLKLRLAATMQGVSAQALVTEALDRLLAEYGDLDVIANHLKRH